MADGLMSPAISGDGRGGLPQLRAVTVLECECQETPKDPLHQNQKEKSLITQQGRKKG